MNRRVFSTFLLVAACGASPGEEVAAQPTGRCAHCGMRITDWLTSTATRANGEHAEFDTPKCLFAFLASEEGAGARDLEVTEYYTRTRRAADAVVYVDGSDVTGPMGPDLIPIESRERAESFVHDHGGTILDLAGARARGPELFRY